MTRTELRSMVQSITSRTDKDTLINSAIDLAIKEIAKIKDFRKVVSEEDLSIRSVSLGWKDGDWDEATLTLSKTDAFDSYTWVSGDQIYLDGGTGTTVGWYTVASKTSDDAIVLSATCGVDATDVSASAIGQPYKLALTGLSQTFQHIQITSLIDGLLSNDFTIKPKRWVVARWPHVSALSPGKPYLGYIEGDYLFMHPISDDNYTMRITYTTIAGLAFAGDSTENPIPETDHAVVCWTSAFIFDSIDLPDQGLVWKGRFAQAVGLDLHSDRIHHEDMVADTGLDLALDPLTGGKIISPEAWRYPFDTGR